MSQLDNVIAFKGKVKLDKAIWDNIWGMYVTFDLEQRPHELTAANPFKKFTKLRKGKVGTRFSAVLVDDDERVVYEDDLMLKGWNDGTSGWRVTFWLVAEGEHPFMRFDKGTEFGMAVVELDDDEEPIDQVKREKVSKPRKQGLSNFAALLCRTPEFHQWLSSTNRAPLGEDSAKQWMCEQLGITTRAALDHDPQAATMFHSLIREPYAEWFKQRFHEQ